MNTKGYRIEIISDIELQDETVSMKKAAASIIELPDDKQMDLQYFTAVYVSTGTNLNNAHFLSSEIVKAKDTIVSKALDVEHAEDKIIGHIYDYAFTRKNGDKVDFKELSSMEALELDNNEIHVVMAGIIYKNRFPEIAKEIADGNWKVSMECYYNGYDVLIGDTLINSKDVELFGLSSIDEELGKQVKVIKDDVEIASGKVVRVLRDICFSGCGIVKNPANPPSVILEVAAEDDNILTINVNNKITANEDNKVTSDNIEDITDSKDPVTKTEDAELQYSDTVGVCVSFKKEIIDTAEKGVNSKVLHTNWCTLYETSCTVPGGDATDLNCLRNKKAISAASVCLNKLMQKKEVNDKRSNLVSELEQSLNKANSLL